MHWASKVVPFNNWGDLQFANIARKLRELSEQAHGNVILHISVDGIRGVDYKLSDVAHVLICYDVPNFAMFKQCCGRGARQFDKSANVEVIVKAGTKLARCRADQIENELDDLETGN